MAFRRRRPDAVDAPPGSAPASGHPRARAVESASIKIAMTLGIIGIGTALAAILGTQDVDAWIVGLVVATVSVVLAAALWTRRRIGSR